MTARTTTAAATAMSAAELKSAREHMGFTTRWLSARLGVTERTLQRWEEDNQVIREHLAAEVRQLIAHTDQTVEALITSLKSAPQSSRVLSTFRAHDAVANDALADPTVSGEHAAPLPASWHRIVCARAASRVPGAVITYTTEAVT